MTDMDGSILFQLLGTGSTSPDLCELWYSMTLGWIQIMLLIAFCWLFVECCINQCFIQIMYILDMGVLYQWLMKSCSISSALAIDICSLALSYGYVLIMIYKYNLQLIILLMANRGTVKSHHKTAVSKAEHKTIKALYNMVSIPQILYSQWTPHSWLVRARYGVFYGFRVRSRFYLCHFSGIILGMGSANERSVT